MRRTRPVGAGRDLGVRLDGAGARPAPARRVARTSAAVRRDDGGPATTCRSTRHSALPSCWLSRVRPGVASRTRLISRGAPVAYEDIADREAAELVGLVGAGAGDQVGDDLVEPRVVCRRRGEFGVAEAGAGAADQRVADLGRPSSPPRTRVRAWSRVPLSSATNAGTCTGSRRSSGPSAPPIIQPAAASSGPRPAARAIERGDRLAPAEALRGDARACPVGADAGGGEQRDAVDEGGGPGPAGAVGRAPRRRGRRGRRPRRCGSPNWRSPRSRAASAGEHDADEQQAAGGAGAAGAERRAGRARRPCRRRTPGRPRAKKPEGLVSSDSDQGARTSERGAERGQEAQPVRR